MRIPRPGIAVRAAVLPLAALAAAAISPAPVASQASDRATDAPAADTADRPLVTDRPDFTESAAAVRRSQLEAGYTLTVADPADTHRLGEALLRVPAVPGLELRLGLPSLVWDARSPTEDGFGDASVGAKLELVRSGGAPGRPDVAVLGGTSLPVGTRGAEGAVPEARLAASMPLSSRTGLGVNVGVARPDDADGRFSELIGSVALGVDAGGGLGVFAEVYGLERTDGRPGASFVDGGVTYAVGPDLQLDARVAAPLDGAGPDLEVGLGVSVRR